MIRETTAIVVRLIGHNLSAHAPLLLLRDKHATTEWLKGLNYAILLTEHAFRILRGAKEERFAAGPIHGEAAVQTACHAIQTLPRAHAPSGAGHSAMKPAASIARAAAAT